VWFGCIYHLTNIVYKRKIILFFKVANILADKYTHLAAFAFVDFYSNGTVYLTDSSFTTIIEDMMDLKSINTNLEIVVHV
jgi:hypothetical protein